MQLPAHLDALAERMDGFIKEQKRSNSEMKALADEMKFFNAAQRDLNELLTPNPDRVASTRANCQGLCSLGNCRVPAG